MERSTCDVCGQPATIHATEIHDGEKTERHLCAAHAGEAGLPGDLVERIQSGATAGSFQEALTRGMLDNFRGTANFIRRYGRLPSSVDDLKEGMALQGSFPSVAIDDAELKAKLQAMEGLIEFCETHGRMPQTLEEWGDFAPDRD
jgi:hypothetical protein